MFFSQPKTCTRILVAVDDSLQSNWAARVASDLAQKLSAQLMLLHVVELPLPLDGEFLISERLESIRRDLGRTTLDRVRFSIPPEVRTATMQVTGMPAEEIAHLARDWQADMIVVGIHGRGRLTKFMLGSTADGVIRNAHCPVICVAHDPCPHNPCPQDAADLTPATEPPDAVATTV
jgi:nucleotide-binding universal stress UspA family protein